MNKKQKEKFHKKNTEMTELVDNELKNLLYVTSILKGVKKNLNLMKRNGIDIQKINEKPTVE